MGFEPYNLSSIKLEISIALSLLKRTEKNIVLLTRYAHQTCLGRNTQTEHKESTMQRSTFLDSCEENVW